MNILFLLRLWPVYGGGETVTICLANEMVERGWNVSVAYFKDSFKEQMPFIDSRITTLRIEGVTCDEFMQDPADADKAQDTVIHYVKKHNVQVIINQWWLVPYITRLKKECGVKVITCLHQAFYTPILDGKGFLGTAKRMFRPLYECWKRYDCVHNVTSFLPYVDRYVFLSSLFQKQFEEMAGYEKFKNKLDAIPNPLVYGDFISREEFEHKEYIVLVVGRMLESQKKFSRILRVWKKVATDERSRRWRLYMVGDGPDLPAYKSMTAELGLRRVSFEGYQQPLPYYRRARIFLMSSQFEGFGMTLVEAQQQGVVPIVMDSFLSLHDIISNGKNGLITKNYDEDDFALAILSLMEDERRLASMAQSSIESCKAFSVQKVVDRWKVLIENIE